MLLRIRRLLYHFIQKLKFPPGRKRLLIVRLDAIGDYILFRNGLSHIKNSERFSGYKITLLGNKLWKDLAEQLDHTIVDEFLWIDPPMLYHETSFSLSRTGLLLKLKIKAFSVVFHPVHSRMYDIDKFLASLRVPQLTGSSGDDINYRKGEKTKADKLYSELIIVPGYSEFEFFRNRKLISGFTGTNAEEMKLEIRTHNHQSTGLKIIIAPGAGHERRKWPAGNFASLIHLLSSSYPSAFFYICGSHSDSDTALSITSLTSVCPVKDMTGKLSLPEFTREISECTLLISNESSAIHLAAAVDVPAVCISNGNMFGRFNPYPTAMNKKIVTVYPDEKFYNPDTFFENVENYKVFSDIDISLIKPEQIHRICMNAIDSNTVKS